MAFTQEQIIKACQGLSRSQGGLNVPDLKTLVSGKTRDELIANMRLRYGVDCRDNDMGEAPGKVVVATQKTEYYTQPVTITEPHQKWCRCVLHVAAKQPDWCLDDPVGNTGKKRDGKTCYNPYAICSAKVKGKRGRDCIKYFDLDAIPENEMQATLRLHKKTKKELYDYWREEREKVV